MNLGQKRWLNGHLQDDIDIYWEMNKLSFVWWYHDHPEDENWPNYWGTAVKYLMPHQYHLVLYFWWGAGDGWGARGDGNYCSVGDGWDWIQPCWHPLSPHGQVCSTTWRSAGASWLELTLNKITNLFRQTTQTLSSSTYSASIRDHFAFLPWHCQPTLPHQAWSAPLSCHG